MIGPLTLISFLGFNYLKFIFLKKKTISKFINDFNNFIDKNEPILCINKLIGEKTFFRFSYTFKPFLVGEINRRFKNQVLFEIKNSLTKTHFEYLENEEVLSLSDNILEMFLYFDI